jgi:hypothetical protein
MARLILVVSFSVLGAACAYDPATNSWRPRCAGPGVQAVGEQPDSLEYMLAVQRYARQHGGKLPPPDLPLLP